MSMKYLNYIFWWLYKKTERYSDKEIKEEDSILPPNYKSLIDEMREYLGHQEKRL